MLCMMLFNNTDGAMGSIMSMIKKSISVTDKQNEWMQSQLKRGEYASDRELLRDLIRKNNDETKTLMSSERS